MTKVPVRTCVGCRRRAPKPEFIRVVKLPDNIMIIDSTGKAPGRGAYICGNPDCLTKALKGERLSRALRGQLGVQVTDALKDRLDVRA